MGQWGGDLLDICIVYNSPNIQNSNQTECEGVLGGFWSPLGVDECLICDGDNTSCADCAEVPNGSAYLDNCGTCDDDSTNDCKQDCMGQWGGDLLDICIVYNSPNIQNSNQTECEGVLGGFWSPLGVDECLICDGDNRTCNKPLATSACIAGQEDSDIDFVLTISDPKDKELTISIESGPSQGVIVPLTGDSLRYKPNGNYNGSDAFSYSVFNGTWTSTVKVVDITDIGTSFTPITVISTTLTVDVQVPLKTL
jgi:hypothetical protein